MFLFGETILKVSRMKPRSIELCAASKARTLHSRPARRLGCRMMTLRRVRHVLHHSACFDAGTTAVHAEVCSVTRAPGAESLSRQPRRTKMCAVFLSPSHGGSGPATSVRPLQGCRLVRQETTSSAAWRPAGHCRPTHRKSMDRIESGVPQTRNVTRLTTSLLARGGAHRRKHSLPKTLLTF